MFQVQLERKYNKIPDRHTTINVISDIVNRERMDFLKKKDKKIESIQSVSKTDVLHGLHLRSTYFERHIQNDELFRPEFEGSKIINAILEKKDALTKSDVIEILNLLNGINNVEHCDGSGWYDYQIQIAYFLSLNGFDTEFKERQLRLTMCL